MAEFNTPKNLKYHKEHEWVKKLDDGNVLIGITDYAQNSLTDITYVGFNKSVGDHISAEEVFGEVESVKSVSDLFIPLSGEIIEINEELEDEPELVNNAPYDKGWLIKINPSNLEVELASLMDSSTYNDYIATL